MSENSLFRLRCTFEKISRLAYLSHLEVTHALERIVRRAGLPFATTKGFSPHMKISFGSALPVGVAGTSEIFDVYLERYLSQDQAMLMLQEASKVGLKVVDAHYIDNDAPAASVAFPISRYVASYAYPITNVVVPKNIEIQKKKGTKILDVSRFLLDEVMIEGNDLIFELVSHDDGSMRVDRFLDSIDVEFEDPTVLKMLQNPSKIVRVGLKES